MQGLRLGQNFARIRSLATGVSPLDPEGISWAEMHSRITLFEFGQLLRTRVPGFQGAVVEIIGDEVSVLSSRRILIPDNPTPEDVESGGAAADVVYVHRAEPDANDYSVPFRVFLPQG